MVVVLDSLEGFITPVRLLIFSLSVPTWADVKRRSVVAL